MNSEKEKKGVRGWRGTGLYKCRQPLVSNSVMQNQLNAQFIVSLFSKFTLLTE